MLTKIGVNKVLKDGKSSYVANWEHSATIINIDLVLKKLDWKSCFTVVYE